MNVEPRSHAELCPVCKGTGKYKYVPENNSTIIIGDLNVHYYETTCHGCMGKGWITITDYVTTYPNQYKEEHWEKVYCNNHITHIDDLSTAQEDDTDVQ